MPVTSRYSTADGITFTISLGVPEAIRQAMSEGFEKASPELRRLFEAIADERYIARQVAEKSHREVGNRAMLAVRRNFARLHQSGVPPPYRAGDNRLSGAMQRALDNESHVRATRRSLQLIDTERLDLDAAHWRRLNFGVGSRGAKSRPPGRFALRFEDVNLGDIGIDPGAAPVDPMVIYRGYFQSPGGEPVSASTARVGQDQFIQTTFGALPAGVDSIPGPRISRGITASNFLDAASRVVANDLPRTYMENLNRAVDRGLSQRAKMIGKFEGLGPVA